MSNAELAIAIVAVVVGALVTGTVAIVWLWAWRDRGRSGREEAYQRLVEEHGVAQKRTAVELGQIAEDVAEVRLRLVELERLLKDVG